MSSRTSRMRSRVSRMRRRIASVRAAMQAWEPVTWIAQMFNCT